MAGKIMSDERWSVIGGGFLGMTLAHRLAQRGRRVTLYEESSGLGGLAGPWSLGEVTWDRHYHVILPSDESLRSLLSELDLEREIQWVKTKTGFFVDGRLYSLSNPWEFLRFPPLGLIDKVRLGVTILQASQRRDWERLERITAVEWLEKWSGKRAVEKIWRPLLRAKLGENCDKTSAAFIWAIIARMYSARRSVEKKEVFGFVPGGYARILSALSAKLRGMGIEIKTGRRVKQIRPANGKLAVAFENGETEECDQLAVTVAPAIAERMCEGLTPNERERLRGIEYQGVICASVLMREPLARFYITNITDSWVPFTAVIEMTALVDPRFLGGKHLVYLPKYVASDSSAFATPDDEIRNTFLKALQRMYPGFREEKVEAFRVSRARFVLPISTLNYSKRIAPPETSIRGLHLVNSSQIVNGTLNVNETIQLADRTMARWFASPLPQEKLADDSREFEKTVGLPVA